VELEGFKKALVENVKVDTATTATVNLKLEPGAESTELTVTAAAPLINAESGTPGQTITERQIVAIPLNNRSVLDLALTAAKVAGDAGTEDPDLASTIPTPGFNGEWSGRNDGELIGSLVRILSSGGRALCVG